MRLDEPKIKAAILHPEEEVRVTAVSYFSGAFSRDETVMPRVIEAVETHGRKTAFRVLRAAASLAQTPATVEWLAGELRRGYDLTDVDEDNYRFAIALILYRAGPEVLLQRTSSITSLPMFPQELRGLLEERLDMLTWDWNRGWAALETLGRDTLRRGRFNDNDVRHAQHIIESLSRHGEEKSAFVVNLLQQRQEDGGEAWLTWIEPWTVSLAGAMRIEPAAALLVSRLADKSLAVANAATTALIKIGADGVVAIIADRMGGGPPRVSPRCRRRVGTYPHRFVCAEVLAVLSNPKRTPPRERPSPIPCSRNCWKRASSRSANGSSAANGGWPPTASISNFVSWRPVRSWASRFRNSSSGMQRPWPIAGAWATTNRRLWPTIFARVHERCHAG